MQRFVLSRKAIVCMVNGELPVYMFLCRANGIRPFECTGMEGAAVEKRIALIGIIVEDGEAAERINDILHQYREYMVGRMGVPYRERQVSVISVIVDAENDIISAISGKLGMVRGVSTKTIYATK